MKNIAITVIVILAAFNYAFAGELRIMPENPEMGAEMVLSYIPSDDFSDDFDNIYNADENTGYYLFLYEFTETEQLPSATQLELTPDDSGRFYATYSLAPKTVFAIAKIARTYDRNIAFDDNNDKFWDFYVHKEGKPRIGSHLKAGLSYLGNLPENCSRAVDFEAAVDNLEKETKLFPENLTAKIGLTSLLFDLKKITEEEFIDRMKLYTDAYFDRSDESAVRSVSRALRTLNRAAEAHTIEQQFVQSHPASSLAREHHLSKLSSAETLEDFSRTALDYIRLFPNSENLPRIYSALVTAYLQINEVKPLLGLLESLNNVPPTVYSQIAEEIAERRELMPDMNIRQQLSYAREIYAIGLEMINADEYDHQKIRPAYFTEIAWYYEGQLLEGAMYEAGGDIYYLSDKFHRANDYYLNAIIIQSDMATDVLYQNCINSFINVNSADTAYEVASRAIKHSKTNDFILDVHDSLFSVVNRNRSLTYDNAFDELRDEARNRRVTKLKYELLDRPAPAFAVQTLDDRIYEIGDFRGRTFIAVFWATWCGPCQVMMNAVNNLYKDRKNDPDVVFAGINIWEKSDTDEGDIEEFLEENEYNFAIYLDKTGILPQKFGITGLPVAVVIDPDGRLRYKISGFPGEKQFDRRIEDLLYIIRGQ
jgi:thiol-disulfide isomerase/thioredoxin